MRGPLTMLSYCSKELLLAKSLPGIDCNRVLWPHQPLIYNKKHIFAVSRHSNCVLSLYCTMLVEMGLAAAKVDLSWLGLDYKRLPRVANKTKYVMAGKCR